MAGMARGFESKMVEFKQEEAARGRSKAEKLTAEEQARLTRRASLELARARAAADLERRHCAGAPPHARTGDRGPRRAARPLSRS